MASETSYQAWLGAIAITGLGGLIGFHLLSSYRPPIPVAYPTTPEKPCIPEMGIYEGCPELVPKPQPSPYRNITVQDHGVFRCIVWTIDGSRACFNKNHPAAMEEYHECLADPVACWKLRYGPQPGE